MMTGARTATFALGIVVAAGAGQALGQLNATPRRQERALFAGRTRYLKLRFPRQLLQCAP